MNGKGFREFKPMGRSTDWVVIYKIEDGALYLARTGSHSDVFKNLKIRK